MTKRIYYNKTNICDNIDENGNNCENKLIPGKAYRQHDIYGRWTGKYVCPSHRYEVLKRYQKETKKIYYCNICGNKFDENNKCSWKEFKYIEGEGKIERLCKKCYYNRFYKSERQPIYTNDELLEYLRQFEKEEGRIPTKRDLINNPRYPGFTIYARRFGSWSNALKLVGMDLDTKVMQGYLDTSQEKGRYAEIKVINHFGQRPMDLAGENCISPCDGICPHGKTYDVKSSKFYVGRKRYDFGIRNKYKEEIEIFYLLGFNEDWTKLDYGWRIPGEIAEKDHFLVGLNNSYEFNVENMKEYDITEKFKDILAMKI